MDEPPAVEQALLPEQSLAAQCLVCIPVRFGQGELLAFHFVTHQINCGISAHE